MTKHVWAPLLVCGLLALATGAGLAAAVLTQVWVNEYGDQHPVLAGPVAYTEQAGQAPRGIAYCQDNRLVTADAAGRRLWWVELEGKPHGTVAVADLDRDGRNELVALAGDDVVCVRGQKVAWRRTLEGGANGAAACANVLGDSRLEVIAADGEGALTCLDHQGRVLWRLLAESARRPLAADPFISRLNWNYERYLNRDATAAPAVGDVDGDREAEIIMATEPGFVYCFTGRGEWQWQFRASRGCYGAPVIADLEGDRRAEVLVGSADRHLYILDGATGRPRAAVEAGWGIGPNIAAADLDGDGRREVVFGDSRGGLYCADARGQVRWRLAFKSGRLTSECGDDFLAPPAIADVDGDGQVELLVGMRGRDTLSVLDRRGQVEGKQLLETAKEALLYESGVWHTPVVADLDGDGRCEIVVATRFGAMRCLRAGAAGGKVAWAGERGTPGLSGCVASSGGPAGQELRRAAAGMQGGIRLTADATSLVEGVVRAQIRRPGQAGVLLSRISVLQGPPELRVDQVLAGQESFGLAVPTDSDWPRQVDCVLVDGAGKVLARAALPIKLTAAQARVQVEQAALSAARGLISSLGLNWQSAEALLAARLAGYGQWSEQAPGAAEQARRLAAAAQELKVLAQAAPPALQGGRPVLLAWAANPWEPFDEARAWPPAAPAQQVEVALYGGEYEAGALNLLSLSALPLGVQVAVGELASENGHKLPAGHLELRQTAMVPRSAGEMVGDALVRLNEAQVVQVQPLQAAQLWLTVRAGEALPGVYRGEVKLTELTPGGRTVSVPLQVRVWPLALPAQSPVRFCTWGYLDNSLHAAHLEAAVADMVAHKNNVFPCLVGVTAYYDAQGALEPIDWSGLDRMVDRFARHGMLLLQGWEDVRYRGQGEPPAGSREKAFAEWMRRLAAHLREKGVDYPGWAIYIMDEPGLDHGPRIRFVLEYGPRIKQADPRIQIYTDPVVPMGLDDLERAAACIDIWCPEQDSLYRLWGETPDMHAQERLDIFHRDSREVWTYECFPRAKKLSPLGYYRHQAWLAWQLGLNGLGFWTYCTDPASPWLPGKDEYVLVYPGRDGPIPSKRWEACRDGVEDYQALWLARQAATQAGAEGAGAEIDRLARRVVEQRATWPELQAARRRLAEITLELQASKGK